VPLFERVGRRLVLTEEGSKLHEFANRYLSELQHLSAELTQQTPSQTAPLRIAAARGFGRSVLFPLLRSNHFDSARLQLTYHAEGRVLDLVERGDFDIGAVSTTRVSSCLQFMPAYVSELALIAPRESDIEVSQLASQEGLAALPLITYEECNSTFRAWFEAVLGGQPESTTQVHHLAELDQAIEMVALGRGYSIAPVDAAASMIKAKRVQVIRIGDRLCLSQEYVVVRSSAYLRREVTTLIERLRAASAAAGRQVDLSEAAGLE
jgi:DNA-binding transcriptional LysR family regulator